ncbi:MAG: hypothetical protein AVDCRST_MAG12-2595 [uncultured Rubrobacteraceae bacterium]|uniref:DUF2382 domain-containing protein n=1 Tax=uncultured Rubrobacteraceae bacterium TaxID=349277 RepID=A0A6J4SIN6_9ACTN|nr:MAG: hypothetical protein AVDCRST_MAG12-2595 [uncultured Rubrobacteraceae bacterium]
MADKAPVHVLSRADGWAVVREGRERATSVHPTQAEAARAGREIARKDGAEFLLHAKDGRIRDRSDYGGDLGRPSTPPEDAPIPPAAGVAGAAARATGGMVGLATGVVGGAIEGLGPAASGVSQDNTASHEEGRTDDSDEEAGGLAYEERYADYDVHDRGGERLGHVDALFIDEDDRPEYIGVKMGLLGARSTLIPWTMVTRADEQGGYLEVGVDKEKAANGPAFEDDQEITPELERQVRDHYGIGRAAEDRGAYGDYRTSTENTGATAGPGDLGATTGGAATGGLRERRDGGEAPSQPQSDPAAEGEIRVQRSEEELVAGTREREAGAMRIRKRVRTERERLDVPVRREEVRVERVPVSEATTGAEIGEEEVVVPVTETEVVVSKRPVVKEEIRIHKDVVEETEVVEEDVRREEIDVVDETDRRREG